MTFPVVFHLLGRPILAHQLFESAAYLLGFQTYLALRRREPHIPISLDQRLWIIVAAMTGALLGSKLLAWIESPQDYAPALLQLLHPDSPQATLARSLPLLLGGKTIVGGLLGGWLAVELAKPRMRLHHTTGDAYAPALAVAIAVGRIGCFLTGLPDHTYGTPSQLPWAVDFGDHIPRHPTQLYESAFALLALAALYLLPRLLSRPSSIFHPPSSPPHPYSSLFPPLPPGLPFRLFLAAYLTFRLLVEFIKPTYKPYAGLSAIQLASLTGALLCLYQIRRLTHSPHPSPPIATARATPRTPHDATSSNQLTTNY